MSKKSNLSRRTFLSRSAIATGGIISLSMIGTPGRSKSQETQKTQETREFESFTAHQGLTVEALAECIFPADENGPGATDAHVVTYIDRSLKTHLAEEKAIYDKGLVWLDQFATAAQGAPFIELTVELQNKIVSAMDRRRSPADWPSDADMPPRTWLRHVIGHTMEGMFTDPQYGGNYNEIGWKLLNFPGLKAFGYDAPFGYYDATMPELEYPPFEPYTG